MVAVNKGPFMDYCKHPSFRVEAYMDFGKCACEVCGRIMPLSEGINAMVARLKELTDRIEIASSMDYRLRELENKVDSWLSKGHA